MGTPAYVYSAARLRRDFRAYRDAFAPERPLLAYAVKANSSLAVLRVLAAEGAGADTVSEGEIRRALAAGVPAGRILFSGVGKTDGELAFALRAGVDAINVESEPELERLARVARASGVRARAALRVNPDVGAGAHAKITTGQAGSKFGVPLPEAERLYARLAGDPVFEPRGLACHIGSQITDLRPLAAAFRTVRAVAERLRARGLSVPRLDLGGGLGVDYGDGSPSPPGPADLAAVVREALAGFEAELAFEPGRSVAARAGVLLTTAIHVAPHAGGRTFLVLDAGMNDLARPALYNAWHALEPVATPRPGELIRYDVVGPVCESSDVFARGRALPPLEGGDLLAVMTAGAYGAVMAGEYNSRPLAPEVMVDGDRWAVVRPRPSYDDMLARERAPDWL